MMAVHTSKVEPLPHQISADLRSHVAQATITFRIGR